MFLIESNSQSPSALKVALKSRRTKKYWIGLLTHKDQLVNEWKTAVSIIPRYNVFECRCRITEKILSQ